MSAAKYFYNKMFLTNAEDRTLYPRSWLEIPMCGIKVVKSNLPKKDIIYLTIVGCLNLDQYCGSYHTLSLNSIQGCLILYMFSAFLLSNLIVRERKGIFPSFLLTFSVNCHLMDNSPGFTDNTVLGVIWHIHFKLTVPLEEGGRTSGIKP